MLTQDLLKDAIARRKLLLTGTETENTACETMRLFHGHADGDSSINIDRYGKIGILEHKRELSATEIETLTKMLGEMDLSSLLLKAHRSLDLPIHKRFTTLGEPIPERFSTSEYGLRVEIRPFHPHSAGLFLDARPLRQYLQCKAQGARVLNLFAFSGSLGIAALKGGAASVVHADKSAEAKDWTAANYGCNELRLDNRDFVLGDLYKNLPKIANKAKTDGRKQYDIVVLDPPPQVYTTKRSAPRPKQQDFLTLAKLSAMLVKPDGMLICLFHRFGKTREEFEAEVLNTAQTAGIRLDIADRLISGDDFKEARSEDRLKITIFKRDQSIE